jgi:hypothetical protein
MIIAGSQALDFSVGEFDALFLDSTETPKSHNFHPFQEFGFSNILTENSGILLRLMSLKIEQERGLKQTLSATTKQTVSQGLFDSELNNHVLT